MSYDNNIMEPQKDKSAAELAEVSRELRLSALEMLYKAGSGHPGSTFSTMDILTALYFGGILKYDSARPDWNERDYFLMSNGHAAPALYAILAKAGYFAETELGKLRQLGAGAQGHPHRGSLPGIEISSGSLGQGLSVGIGLAQAARLKNTGQKVYVMMSDGEQEEGSTWEAIMLAPKLKLNNLIAIIDKNGMQIDGATNKVMPSLDPLAEKYRAFGWRVLEINGHDFDEILSALKEVEDVKDDRRSVAIIANTVRGKGVSFMENNPSWHAGKITEKQYEQAKNELMDK
ncbi:MAG: transketolase [bacterium]|nr:transketolase [bacterium]